MIRSFAMACLLAALPGAAPAQTEAPDGEGGLEEGLKLLERGTELLIEELLKEMGPALEALRERLGDLDAYHLPEVLPNGDIIIRRKTPLDRIDPEDGVDL